MLRARFVSSARARFIAAAATIVALVAVGGVTASPAFAANITLTVIDDNTSSPWAMSAVYLIPTGGGSTVQVITDASGIATVTDDSLPPGTYEVRTTDGTMAPSVVDIVVATGENTIEVHVDKFKVSGSIPIAASSGSTASVERDIDGTWTPMGGSQTVNSGDGSFELRVPFGPGTYRIQFLPGDASDYYISYSDPFVVDGVEALTEIGPVALVTAGTIRGNVESFATNLPMEGAVAHAWSGGIEIATATTDVNGDFRLKVAPQVESYTVYVDAVNHVRHYYDFVVEEAGATPIPLTAENGYAATGIDFRLEIDTSDLIVNVIDASGDYAVDYTLYRYDDAASQWNSFPVYVSHAPSTSLTYNQLPLGDYRLVLQHPTSAVVLPANAACYLEFESVYVTDIVLVDVLVDPSAAATVCDEPAWIDGDDAMVTGTVENIDDADHTVIAQLWSRGPGQLFALDSSVVDPLTGDYELSGVRYPYDYFIKFLTDDRDPLLDTILGASSTTWAMDDDVAEWVYDHDPIALDPDSPITLADHDVTLPSAAIFAGSATEEGTGSPVRGQVVATDVESSSPYYSDLDADGDFSFKLPPDRSHVLSIESSDGEWVDEFWQDAAIFADAEVIDGTLPGLVGTFNFVLARTPAQLFVWPSDPLVDDEVIIHLYYKADGSWEELETQTTHSGEAYFIQDYDTGLDTGLDEGDYRVRFETLTGTWIEATQASWGKDSYDGVPSETSTPSCFIDFEGLTSGIASYIYFEYDITAQTTECGAEPPATGTVQGHVESSALWGSEDVVDHHVDIYGFGDSFVDHTDTHGNFAIADVPSGNYTVEVSPDAHVPGQHEYYYSADVVIAGGEQDLGTLVATRYGNVIAEFSNWDDATMGTSFATVYLKKTGVDGDYWEASGLTVEVSSTGLVELPGILITGQYGLRIDFGATYAPTYVGGGLLAPTAPFAGTAELDYDYGLVALALDELTTISGTVVYGSIPLEDALVVAHPIGAPDDLIFGTTTGADGSYTLEVAPGYDYEVLAMFGGLQMQFWLGNNYPLSHLGPIVATPLPVGDDPVENINFSLIANPEVVFDLLVEEWDSPGDDFYDFEDVDVHLYKKVATGWQEVDTALTDPFAILTSVGGGDYRLRFSYGGEWLAVHDIFWENYLIPYDSSNGWEEFDPAACYYDFTDVDNGSAILVQLSLDSDSPVVCGAEPPLVSPPVTTTTKPKPKPVAVTDEVVLEPTSTPTPSPEPTEDTASGGGGGTEETDVDKPVTTSSVNFTWLFWLIAIIVLLLLVGGGVYIYRRR